jgi:predicted lipoprotein
MKKEIKKDFEDNQIEYNQNSLKAFVLGARFINQLYRKNGFDNQVVIEEAGKALNEVVDLIEGFALR